MGKRLRRKAKKSQSELQCERLATMPDDAHSSRRCSAVVMAAAAKQAHDKLIKYVLDLRNA